MYGRPIVGPLIKSSSTESKSPAVLAGRHDLERDLDAHVVQLLLHLERDPFFDHEVGRHQAREPKPDRLALPIVRAR
jgi:hypothetical protein